MKKLLIVLGVSLGILIGINTVYVMTHDINRGVMVVGVESKHIEESYALTTNALIPKTRYILNTEIGKIEVTKQIYDNTADNIGVDVIYVRDASGEIVFKRFKLL